jgi:hypothetical protein
MAQFPDDETKRRAKAGKLPVVDWTQPARRILDAGDAVAYWRGTKWLLRPSTVIEVPEPLAPGQVAAYVNGPITVGTGAGAIVIGDYAVEGSRHEWLLPGRFADACARMGTGAAPIVFGPRRFDTWDAIVHHFSALLALQDRFKTRRTAYAKGVDALYWRNHEFLTALLRDAGMRPGDRFLDIGCSSYPWAAAIAHDYGMEVWGCDVIPRDFFGGIDWFHYREGDGTSLPEFPVKFDFVWSRGLTPLCYCRSLDHEPVVRLRDALVRAMNRGGTIYFVIYSENTGRPRDEDSFGELTTKQLASFWGEVFPHVATAKSAYVAVRASGRPIAAATFADDAATPGIWEKFAALHASRREIVHALMKISNRIWPLVGFEPVQRVHVLGTGELADLLVAVLKIVHRSFPAVTAGAEVPPNATFVFQMPGSEYGGELPRYGVTLRELIELISRRDFWCVGGDHDLFTVAQIEKRLDARPAAS